MSDSSTTKLWNRKFNLKINVNFMFSYVCIHFIFQSHTNHIGSWWKHLHTRWQWWWHTYFGGYGGRLLSQGHKNSLQKCYLQDLCIYLRIKLVNIYSRQTNDLHKNNGKCRYQYRYILFIRFIYFSFFLVLDIQINRYLLKIVLVNLINKSIGTLVIIDMHLTINGTDKSILEPVMFSKWKWKLIKHECHKNNLFEIVTF